MRFRILGPVEIEVDGEVLSPPRRRERCLLGVLLLETNRVVSVDRLADLLWDGDSPKRVRSAIQGHVSRLRAMLADAGGGQTVELVYVGNGYRIVVDPEIVDAEQFRVLVERAAQVTDLAECADLLRAALDLWRGPALADAVDGMARERLCSDLEERRLVAVEDLASISLALGREREVLPELARAISDNPGRESLAALHMRALYGTGRRVDALDVYARARAYLADELGLDPSPELRELHQAILRDELKADASARPPKTSPPEQASWTSRVVPRQLPADAAGFTGRAAHLQQLDNLLPSGSDRPVSVFISAIGGTAGVGKTALAVHWAHRVRDRFPDGQLYVDLRGYASGPPLKPIEVLARFLYALGVPGAEIPVELETAAGLYRSLLDGRRILVVLDNAVSAEQVRPLLPASGGSLVVVTSRDQPSGLVARDGAQLVNLDVLAADEAHALLVYMLGAERVDAEPEPTDALAQLCGHLPLALRLAAANLAVRPSLPIAEYVAQLRGRDRLAVLTVPGDPDNAVSAAFDLSFARLPAAAQRIFRLVGLVPGPDVSAQAVAILANVGLGEAVDSLRTLGHVHLLYEHAAGRYSCHDLLRWYAASRAEREESERERDGARERLFGWYLRNVNAAADLLYPHMLRLPVVWNPDSAADIDDSPKAQAWLDEERPNLVAAITYAAENGPWPLAWLLTDGLRGYWWRSGHSVDWLAAANVALAAARRAGDVQAQAAAQLSLGDVYQRQGRYAEALEHYAVAVELARRVGWLEGQPSTLSMTARAHWSMGRLKLAADRLNDALAIDRDLGPATGPMVARLGNLGTVNHELGRLRQAASAYAEALALHRQLGSREGEMATLISLGSLSRDLGRLKDASDHLTQALSLARAIGSRFGEAVAFRCLAAVQRDGGRYDGALESAGTALRLAREIEDHRAEADAHNILGSIRRCLEHPRQALSDHQLAMNVAVETADKLTQLMALLGLATTRHVLGNHDEALTDALRALDLARSLSYGLLEGEALTIIAELYLSQGEEGKAEESARRALENHQHTGYRLGEARAHLILGRIQRRANNVSAAKDHWRQAHVLFMDIGAPEADEASALLAS